MTTESPLLTIDNLSTGFKRNNKPASASDKTITNNISLSLHAGKTLAIVGESGSGKSITALSILQLLPYPKAFHGGGNIVFDGKFLMQNGALSNEDELRKLRGNDISIIFQEPLTALNPLHKVGKQIAEIIDIHDNNQYSSSDIKQRVIALLEQVNIPNPEEKINAYPHELSGGQRQRVMIAMAIANKPKLLIADEPTTALDVTTQRDILDLLRELQADMGMAILLITHDLGVVKHYSDNVMVMNQGNIVEVQPTADLFKQPKEAYTQALLSAEPSGKAPRKEASKKILAIDDLTVKFPIKKGLLNRTVDYFYAVKNVSFSLMQGTTLGIVGESGSGKTTLIQAILRLIPSEGNIVFNGKTIQGLTPDQMRPLRKQMQIVFQDPFGSLNPRLTIGDIISEGLVLHENTNKVETNIRVSKILKEVGLDDAMRLRYPHELSGGQRQRVAIARAAILRPSLIVLDEPTSALDRSIQAQIIDLLRTMQAQHNISYLFVSHDLHTIRSISHEVIVMKQGEIVERGNTDDVFEQPQHPYTQQLLSAALNL